MNGISGTRVTIGDNSGSARWSRVDGADLHPNCGLHNIPKRKLFHTYHPTHHASAFKKKEHPSCLTATATAGLSLALVRSASLAPLYAEDTPPPPKKQAPALSSHPAPHSACCSWAGSPALRHARYVVKHLAPPCS